MSSYRDQIEAYKNDLVARPPVKGNVPIRIIFFGSSGGGKSVTAGLAALGLAGRNGGMIAWVDGEGGRSGWAIDVVSEIAVRQWGGKKQQWVDRFQVIHISKDFHPLRAVAAIEKATEEKFVVIILDLMTQLWSAAGGYLELKEAEISRMAGDTGQDASVEERRAIEAKRDRVASVATMKVKPVTHNILRNLIVDCPLHVVMCCQATERVHKEAGKPLERDNFESPIQEKVLLQTAMISGEVYADLVKSEDGTSEVQGGFVNFRDNLRAGKKTTHPEIARLIPKDGQQWTLTHSEALAKWASTAGASPFPAQPADNIPSAQPMKDAQIGLSELKRELSGMLVNVHCNELDKNRRAKIMNQYLWDECGMLPEWNVQDLTADQLREVILKVKSKQQVLI